MATLLERKPTGRLVLMLLDCGCETWMTTDRVGRRVKTCGEGFIHSVAKGRPPFGHFVQLAQAELAAAQRTTTERPQGAEREGDPMSQTLISLVLQPVVLQRADLSLIEIAPSGRIAKVEYDASDVLPSPVEGVPCVAEPPPARVDGFPGPEDTGRYIVASQAALAARQLGMRTQAEIYSPGALGKRPDGQGMCATQLRRWPDWPSPQSAT